MDRIARRYFLVFGNAKLFLSGFLCEIPFKVCFGADMKGTCQLIGNDRIIPAFSVAE